MQSRESGSEFFRDFWREQEQFWQKHRAVMEEELDAARRRFSEAKKRFLSDDSQQEQVAPEQAMQQLEDYFSSVLALPEVAQATSMYEQSHPGQSLHIETEITRSETHYHVRYVEGQGRKELSVMKTPTNTQREIEQLRLVALDKIEADVHTTSLEWRYAKALPNEQQEMTGVYTRTMTSGMQTTSGSIGTQFPLQKMQEFYQGMSS